ncbi:hypothetical protein [Boseongicola aestuarii]|uniref:hypothetical protein n=1 Tax=Boseongicola aestuarii TaxID=1470561 RepID=UPI00112FFE06|nr:hypothetical protein [Boseongicola aestuarii]
MPAEAEVSESTKGQIFQSLAKAINRSALIVPVFLYALAYSDLAQAPGGADVLLFLIFIGIPLSIIFYGYVIVNLIAASAWSYQGSVKVAWVLNWVGLFIWFLLVVSVLTGYPLGETTYPNGLWVFVFGWLILMIINIVALFQKKRDPNN